MPIAAIAPNRIVKRPPTSFEASTFSKLEIYEYRGASRVLPAPTADVEAWCRGSSGKSRECRGDGEIWCELVC